MLWNLTCVFGFSVCLVLAAEGCLKNDDCSTHGWLRCKRLGSQKSRFCRREPKRTSPGKTEKRGVGRGSFQLGLLIKIIPGFSCLSSGYTVLSCRVVTPHTVLVLIQSPCSWAPVVHARRGNSVHIIKIEVSSFYEILKVLAFEVGPACLCEVLSCV